MIIGTLSHSCICFPRPGRVSCTWRGWINASGKKGNSVDPWGRFAQDRPFTLTREFPVLKVFSGYTFVFIFIVTFHNRKYSSLKIVSICNIILHTRIYKSPLFFSRGGRTLCSPEGRATNLTGESLEFTGLHCTSGESYPSLHHDVASSSFPVFHMGNILALS